MAYASKATTALVAAALGLATVTAAFVTVSSATSVADPAPIKIQDRLQSQVRLISIDDPTETIVVSDAETGVTVATRTAPVAAPRTAELPVEAVTIDVPLPRAKPVELAALSDVPLPQPRPQAEVIVGSLTADDMTSMR